MADDEMLLRARIIALASEFGRYGYRRVTALLRQEGWKVNHKRVERIWRQEGLKDRRNSRSVGDSGSTTAPASGCVRATPTTSGPTTSCPPGRTRAGPCEC